MPVQQRHIARIGDLDVLLRIMHHPAWETSRLHDTGIIGKIDLRIGRISGTQPGQIEDLRGFHPLPG